MGVTVVCRAYYARPSAEISNCINLVVRANTHAIRFGNRDGRCSKKNCSFANAGANIVTRIRFNYEQGCAE